MTNTTHYEIINGQRVKVTVLPAAEPKAKRASRGAYVTQKERAAQQQARDMKLAFMYDAYELAAQFGIEQKTITEFVQTHSRAPKQSVKSRRSDFDL